ncbi:lutropin-choriogonadotropic hormone receptor-like, partial [Saccoglossus kowalevskii]|uniref:Leucine-rich repeat-containing G-protein coupled receptor 5-like n=1 Tax=Saccoglossus kowalevskii TaxID=10224 RepID=A0ABM0MRH0_SACKO
NLDANKIKEVPATSFQGLISLKYLWLAANYMNDVPTEALSLCHSLEALTLALNNISLIKDYAFINMTKLNALLLQENIIRILGDHAFDGLDHLTHLDLNLNQITEFPVALSVLSRLKELDLQRNRISYIRDNAFSGNPELKIVELLGNSIRSVGKYAFSNMPKLEKLALSTAKDLKEFPDLTGTSSISGLHLDRCSIQSVPDDLCIQLPNLKSLDLHSNPIQTIPNLSECNELRIINLGGTAITSLEGKPFIGLFKLRDLTLNNNYITIIPEDAFVGLTDLQYLDLQRSAIEEIHPNAFAPLKHLENLNLSENKFRVLPTVGLKKLVFLKTQGTETLHDFPSAKSFPQITRLYLEYEYHCCEFLQMEEESEDPLSAITESFEWLSSHAEITDNVSLEHFTDISDVMNIDYNYNMENDNIELDSDFYNDDFTIGDFEDISAYNNNPIECLPYPTPFTPCDDLFGWWALRCGVWVVFLLALFGNGTVIFVIVVSRTKMCVPRFLICNLACADFCMAIYLGFLAIIDASTLGDFKKHAVIWQHSSGCQIAGFLAVLSSELSVFTLAVITMERNYAITHAMHLNKRLSLKTASIVMAGGWLLSLFCATLPLVGFSSYTKFAICLPFETSPARSLGFVMGIMTLNALAFVIIVGCYLKMYCSILGSQAWNSNDSRVAKRMALLVFTDFACWAPIAFFSITSMFHTPLISLDGAKVLTIFVLPLNSCANPFLYAIFTNQFKKDCSMICRRLEERSVLTSRSVIKMSNSRNQYSSSVQSSRRLSVNDKNHHSNSNESVPTNCNYQQLAVKQNNDYQSSLPFKDDKDTCENLLESIKSFGDIPLVMQKNNCQESDGDC